MKLLLKKQAQEESNIQKASQIKEGVMIAKKIDVLRETLASLEVQRETFLAGSKAELKKRTASLQKEKESLESEIRQLEERRKDLLKPIEDEWIKLTEAKSLHAIEKEEFNLKKDELQIKTKRIEQEEERVKKIKTLVTEDKAIAEELTQASLLDRTKAANLISKQIEDHLRFSQEWAEKDTDIQKREKALITQANFNEYRKDSLDKREQQLNDKERFINDKYETLQRTIKRLKN